MIFRGAVWSSPSGDQRPGPRVTPGSHCILAPSARFRVAPLLVLLPRPNHRSPNPIEQSAPLESRRTWFVVPLSRTTTITSLPNVVETTTHPKARNPRIPPSRTHGGVETASDSRKAAAVRLG